MDAVFSMGFARRFWVDVMVSQVVATLLRGGYEISGGCQAVATLSQVVAKRLQGGPYMFVMAFNQLSGCFEVVSEVLLDRCLGYQ